MRPLVQHLMAIGLGVAGAVGIRSLISPSQLTTAGDLPAAHGASQTPGDGPASHAQPAPADGVALLEAAGLIKDDLEFAAKAFAAIQALTADDFRRLEESGELPKILWEWRSFEPTVPSYQFQSLALDAFVERWLAVEPEGGRAAMQRLAARWQAEPRTQDAGVRLLSAVAQVRPEEFLQALSPTDFSNVRSGWEEAFSALAARDSEAARRFQKQIPPSVWEATAEKLLATGLPRADPVAAARLAKTKGNYGLLNDALNAAEEIGPGMVRQVVEAAGADLLYDGRRAELVTRYPATFKDLLEPGAPLFYPDSEETIHQLRQLPAEERKKLLADLAAKAPGARTELMESLVIAWAREEPAEATKWAFEHPAARDPKRTGLSARDAALLEWRRRAPEEALEWWRGLPESEEKRRSGNQLAAALLNSENLDASWKMEQSLETFRPGSGADTLEVVIEVLTEEPHFAAAWIQQFPTEKLLLETGTTINVERFARDWFGKDPEAARAWAQGLPEGGVRAQAFSGCAQSAAKRDPAEATGWVDQISDPAVRNRAAMESYDYLRRRDPVGAREWLATLAVDDAWRARFLRFGQ